MFGILWGKGAYLGTHPETIIARFPTAGGAERGDPVYVSGIKHGVIGNIEQVKGGVVMTLTLDRKATFTKNATASIMMLELMGGKKIEITEGTSEETFDPARDTLIGTASGDLSSLIALGSELSANIRSIAVRGDSLLTSLNAIFADESFRSDLRASASEARKAMENLNSVVAANRAALADAITNIKTLAAKLNTTVDNISEPMEKTVDEMRTFIAKASSSVTRADSILASLESVARDAKQDGTLAHKLLRDKAFASRLDSMLTNVSKLVEQVRFQGLDANIRFFNSSTPVK